MHRSLPDGDPISMHRSLPGGDPISGPLLFGFSIGTLLPATPSNAFTTLVFCVKMASYNAASDICQARLLGPGDDSRD